jgi:SAM-dependent methyltransferase
MARKDFYASPFGAAYSAYMERPRLSRLVGKVVWGGDVTPYYESMRAIAEAAPGSTIVDCPCGAGPALRALDVRKADRYVGVDLSPAMLRRARERADARGLKKVELARGDAAALPLPDGSADLFLSYWGLHCFADPAAALCEAARALRAGGRLVGSTFVRGKGSLRQRLLVRPGRGDFGAVPTAEQVPRLLREAGFEEPAIKRSGPMLFFDALSVADSPPAKDRAAPSSLDRGAERLVDERPQ